MPNLGIRLRSVDKIAYPKVDSNRLREELVFAILEYVFQPQQDNTRFENFEGQNMDVGRQRVGKSFELNETGG